MSGTAIPTLSPTVSRSRSSLLVEVGASVADMGTFLPLAVGMSIACGLNFGLVLLCAGLANIYSGWRFRQPIPVQPMKALAATAIAAGWSSGELALSGAIMGSAMLVLAITGLAQRISERIPDPAVRGIQLAAALLLCVKAVKWLIAVPLLPPGRTPADGWHVSGIDSLLLAAVALAVL